MRAKAIPIWPISVTRPIPGTSAVSASRTTASPAPTSEPAKRTTRSTITRKTMKPITAVANATSTMASASNDHSAPLRWRASTVTSRGNSAASANTIDAASRRPTASPKMRPSFMQNHCR